MSTLKEKFTIEPIFDSKEQTSIGLTNSSWVCISVSSDEKYPTVFYFNRSADPNEYENFADFVENNSEDFYCKGMNSSEAEVKRYLTAEQPVLTASYAEEDEDFNEESGKTWKITVGHASLMKFFNGGLTIESLPGIVAGLEKENQDLISQACDSFSDSKEFNKDPYKYYGLSRRDFC